MHSAPLSATESHSHSFFPLQSMAFFQEVSFCGGDLNDNLPKSPRKSTMLWVGCLEVRNHVDIVYISKFEVSKTATTPNSNVAVVKLARVSDSRLPGCLRCRPFLALYPRTVWHTMSIWEDQVKELKKEIA